ncbi:MAG: choice-of-anchor D domain-containing protein [Acidobacteriaceae bacterium]
MMRFVQTVRSAQAASEFEGSCRQARARLSAGGGLRLARGMRWCLIVCFACWLTPPAGAQQIAQTGPQQLAFAGLRAVAYQGQINAVQTDAQGNLYLLIDQKDGVRLLKTDATGANVLAQAQIGAKGDIGLAMALDPAGNVYVTGTTTSGAMTATAGAAFLTPSGSSTNSLVAKFDASLNTVFVTFAGGGLMAANSIAATADAVFITGSIFAATLPVTPAGIIQAPAFGSTQNGFVEKFSASGATLQYATYLSGISGNTSPAAIAADTSDHAYIAGSTTSAGYATVAAVVPDMLVSGSLGPVSGFLTKLTPAGDGITFSTFIPGAGVTSLAIDATAANLLLSGPVSLGQFPVASVSQPLTAVEYQVLLRMTMDGSSVLGSTVVAAGSQSFVAAGASGTAWVDGSLGLPLLPLTPLSTIGNSFAARVNAANLVDQTVRFGGLAASNPSNAGAPVVLTSIAVDASGEALAAGSFAPYASESLLPTQTFDLPLENAPTAAFPSTVRGAVLPASACNGSLCAGSATYLAKLVPPSSAAAASASLALSVDDSPNLTLRNLGSAEATGVAISASGFTVATNCGTTLPAGEECSIALAGNGPGSITVAASNAPAQTATLPALAAGVTPAPVVVSPKELDFGIVSSASGAVQQTITVTNLTSQSQTFASGLSISSKTTLPYTLAETATDCTAAGANALILAPGSACHITIGLTASNSSTNDGPIQQNWLVGTRNVLLAAYGQAAALSLSAGEIDFGTQYVGGLSLPRYLYLSNNSTAAVSHTTVTLPGSSPFTVADGCPGMLEALSVCQLRLAYKTAAMPSADAVTLSLDQGLTALVTGRSLPQPSLNGASVNPNLSVSATSFNFANAVVVTGVSTTTQTLTITNTGASAFSLALMLTGDFTDTTNCGATLPGGGSCSVVLSFAPSQPGTRQGLLAVTAGAGTTPVYVTLTGVGTAILSQASAGNGTLEFGGVVVGQPLVQWYKITQPFTSFEVTTASASGSPFAAVLVEDIGYGHGQLPSSDFGENELGTCLNCWLGVQFTPAITGPLTGTLALASTLGGNPYVLSLTGSGLPLGGLLLTPVTQDFGPVPLHSTSGSELFALTNLVPGGGALPVAPPALTGDFSLSSAVSGGAACGGPLAYTATCFIEVAYAPATAGQEAGMLTLQAGGASATASLTGYGLQDPGTALNPTSLVFNNVPGATSTLQSVTLTNTSGAVEQVGAVTASTTGTATSSFAATSSCGALAAGGSCTISVAFTPATGPVAGVLTIPVASNVGGAPVQTVLSVPLTGAYTTANAGLQIVPGDVEYGPQPTSSTGETRQFTINNLTAKSLALSVALPRQFVLSGAPCLTLAANASCNFSVSFLPVAGGDITGTLSAQGAPTDGSAALNGLGYVEGFGIGSGALSVTGALQPGELLPFGQVPSGQATQQVLTLTDVSSVQPLTIRRITSEWPFLGTNTCGATLAPAQTCTVTLTYTPINQVSAGTSSPPSLTDTGSLVIESDSASSPDLIDLSGSSTPVTVTSPSDAAPVAALVPSQGSLTFAGTAIGNASATQTITLNNTGTTTLTVLDLQTSPDFTVSSSCSILVAGANCPVTVGFTPQNTSQAGTGPGTRASAVEISSNSGTSLEFVSLVGVATAPSLTLSPTSLNFGSVLVNTTGTMGVQISNTGASPVTLSLSATGDYSVVVGSCPTAGGTLAAGASCTVQVSFLPLETGALSGALSIAGSATGLPLMVPLSGVGVQSSLGISPGSLSFGSVAVGASATRSLTLANTGTAAITRVGAVVSLGTADYTISGPCTVTTLAAGGSCSVTVTFAPAATGSQPGTLTVTSSDISSPAAVGLTGTGAAGGTFTLTANGGGSASATVASGSGTPASYQLAATPGGGFGGTVVLNCTPVIPAMWASCSILPSSLTLAGAAQSATATINTVTSIVSAADASPGRPPRRRRRDTEICLLLPALVIACKARTSRHRAWRRVAPAAWTVLAAIELITAGGCGGGTNANTSNSSLRYVAPGTYQYQVTGSSTSGSVQISQTVTLNLIVQ